MMNVHKDLNKLPNFINAVVTIGTFDGVHLGHQRILNQLKEEAKKISGETVVITFYPHPRKIVGDTSGIQLITTLEEKIGLLNTAGIHHLIIVPFDNAFANLNAESYVKDFLVNKIHPHTLIVGYDHRFGKGRIGNYQLLEHYGNEFNFFVKQIDEQVLAEAAVSSTRVRKALLQADLITAKALLGYDYFFEGTVIKGDQLGRTIGYPTANLQLTNTEKLVPGDGVYAVRLQIENSKFENLIFGGMMYIGSRPVVNGKRRVIEINIFDFDKDIYDEVLKVEVVAYTRGDIHFNGLEALKEQLAKDKLQIQELLNIN
jgi:riboflavin kinase/FMN adenylyltransferase